eukprot:CAMPEP_0183703944 /NCGR_PEP_ID=MMETSP0737-20130205/1476_1 /TAXON_ID=385413 /ORGANISM="Thalassiosira miniscula, Strain CCMP1093" /LENGTH=419 /DNA_ID=CAMNT_0025930751 /DNA_START=13 /DNA_END=1272 /DNA_ORIENTATION=+
MQQRGRIVIILVAAAAAASLVVGLMAYLSPDGLSSSTAMMQDVRRNLRIFKGPWSENEHRQFLNAVALTGWDPAYNKEYYSDGGAFKTAGMIPTRTLNDVKLHANQYFTQNAQGQLPPQDMLPWPLDTALHVAAGTYFYRPPPRNPSLQSQGFSPKWGRVLLYVSTHMSDQHEAYFRYCWRNMLSRLPLLEGVDVAIHFTPNDPAKRKPGMDLIKEVFQDHNIMLYLRNYEGYLLDGDGDSSESKTKQVGAMMTMYEAVQYDYFEGYDWVIRLNPDVLIRDDSYLREKMAISKNSAILVNCLLGTGMYRIHTDFFAVRPEVLKKEYFPKDIRSSNAEYVFTNAIKKTVLKSRPRNFKLVPHADPVSKGTCRVGQQRPNYETPIVHKHVIHPDMCTVPPEDTDFVNKVFPNGNGNGKLWG